MSVCTRCGAPDLASQLAVVLPLSTPALPPCLHRCEDTIMKQPEQQQARLQQGLLYVHTAWCSAGL
jgi:hypothetical protein